MPRRTVQVLECDRCKNEGEPYQVVFPEGTREFILCERHNGPFVKLREADYGIWRRKGRGFKKVNIEDLEK